MIEPIDSFPSWPGEERPPARPSRPHAGNTKGCKFPPQPITKDEAERLIEACGRHKIVSKRNKAMIAVMYCGMLRCSECLSLQRADVNVQSGEIRVLKGKGRKARTIAINSRAMGYVNEWIIEREDRWNLWSGLLFCSVGRSRLGMRLTRSCTADMLANLAKRAGIDKRVHPHGLRHSGACEMRKAGVEIGIISKALGHESIATTAIYLDHIAPVDVTEAMKAMEW